MLPESNKVLPKSNSLKIVKNLMIFESLKIDEKMGKKEAVASVQQKRGKKPPF